MKGSERGSSGRVGPPAPSSTRYVWAYALVWLVLGAGSGVAQDDVMGDGVPLVATGVETLAAELGGGTGGVAVAADGAIYVADFGAILSDPRVAGTKVFRVAADGASAEVFATGFQGASGNTFDPAGNLYQSNIRGHYIAKVAPDGTISEFARAGLVAPVGIVRGPDGSFYVANCGNQTVQRVYADGSSIVFSSGLVFQCPNGITMDDAGNVYVANFGDGAVVKITPDGTPTPLTTLPGGNNGHLIHHRGHLYVVDRGGHRIYRVSLSGEAELLAGSGVPGRVDGAPLEARFNYPNDIGVSPDGRWLYVNDVAVESGGQVLAPMIVRRIAVEPAR